MQRRLTSVFDRLIIATFLLLTFLPMADTYFHIDRSAPPEERRVPAEFPLWPGFGGIRTYVEGLEAYFNDHFGYRKYLIKSYHKRRRKLFGAEQSSRSKTLVGQDGWLYYAASNMVENYRAVSPFSEQDLERWKRAFERRRDWLAARGVRYLVVIAPNKETIYPEHLPAWLKRVGRETRKDQVVRYLREHSDLDIIDLEEPLVRSKPRGRLYWKTDSHWNDRGAFIGYQEVMSRLAVWYPDLRPLPLSAFDVTIGRKPAGNLSTMLGEQNSFEDDVPEFHRKDAVEVKPAAPPILSGSEIGEPAMPPIALETPGRRLRCLFLRDSFTEALRPFLAPHFARSLYIYTMFFEAGVIEKERPDIVVQEIVESFLATTVTVDLEKRDKFPPG
jgi:alginate O-acetyltransferase complex protein AlgJ